jgi:hypothetical protein
VRCNGIAGRTPATAAASAANRAVAANPFPAPLAKAKPIRYGTVTIKHNKADATAGALTRPMDFEHVNRSVHRSDLLALRLDLFALRLDLLGLGLQLAQQLGGAALADDQR